MHVGFLLSFHHSVGLLNRLFALSHDAERFIPSQLSQTAHGRLALEEITFIGQFVMSSRCGSNSIHTKSRDVKFPNPYPESIVDLRPP